MPVKNAFRRRCHIEGLVVDELMGSGGWGPVSNAGSDIIASASVHARGATPRPSSAGAPPGSRGRVPADEARSEEHTSELQSQSNLVCRLLLEKKKDLQPNYALAHVPMCCTASDNSRAADTLIRDGLRRCCARSVPVLTRLSSLAASDA